MCNNPYMLLSHYEILACGTTLWKLWDLTVFAHGLLIHSPFKWWSVSWALHMSLRERGREREREVTGPQMAGYHSSIRWGSIHSLLVQTKALLVFWNERCHHITTTYCSNTVPCCSHHGCSFLSHQLPAHCHLIYSSSGSFFLLTTHLTGPYHTTPMTLMAYSESTLFILKKEAHIQIQRYSWKNSITG